MINVKGTKTALPETDTAQRYALKSEDEVSRTPRLIVGLLMGVAAYLASIFSWGREPAPDTAPEKPVDGEIESERSEGASDHIASPQTSPDSTGPESDARGSAMTLGSDARPASTLNEVRDNDIAPFFVRPGSGNAVAERVGRVGESADMSAGHFAKPVSGVAPPLTNADLPTKDDDSTDNDESPGSNEPSDSNVPSDNNEPADGEPTEPGSNDGDNSTEPPPNGNRAPRVSGPVYLLDVAPCTALVIALHDLLSNAQDPDGDVLTVQNLTVSSGTLTASESGWLFHSSGGQPRPITLTYQVTDGELTTDAVAHFSVVAQPVIVGSAADDMLLGSLCADEIDGAGGDDNIDGRAGHDVINGGAGDDHIVAGDGNDVVFGGDGHDIIFGGAGNDHISGGSGDDKLFGGDGNDVIFGNTGEDYLSGGNGNDLLLGGDGDDVILDGAGRDNVFGGMGNDRVVASLDGDNDIYDGGEGSDTLDYSHATQGLVIDLVGGVASGVEIGHDAITGFETVLGGQGGDRFTLGGESVARTLTGGAGDDVFAFASASGGQPNAVSPVIMDFGVGDRIRVSEYDIFLQDEEPGDRFEHVYNDADDDDDDDDSPIRYRHDRDDVSEWTVIESDVDDDDRWAVTVTLNGTHKLSWSTERDDGLEWLS